MTPAQLAEVHAAAFTTSRPWGADEFASLLDSRGTEIWSAADGFALARTVAGESELLTLAVAPAAQGKGLGRTLLREWLGAVRADTAFLEVASDNTAALGLYRSEGFAEVARRSAYYTRIPAGFADAIVMRRALPLGQDA